MVRSFDLGAFASSVVGEVVMLVAVVAREEEEVQVAQVALAVQGEQEAHQVRE